MKDAHVKQDAILQRLAWDDDERADYSGRTKSFTLKLACVTRLY